MLNWSDIISSNEHRLDMSVWKDAQMSLISVGFSSVRFLAALLAVGRQQEMILKFVRDIRAREHRYCLCMMSWKKYALDDSVSLDSRSNLTERIQSMILFLLWISN